MAQHLKENRCTSKPRTVDGGCPLGGPGAHLCNRSGGKLAGSFSCSHAPQASRDVQLVPGVASSGGLVRRTVRDSFFICL